MSDEQSMVLCYNRGCAKKFDPDNNLKDSCVYHPGDPFFHDAYKGWSCCKKKCTDFTEFLNIKGCTVGYHNPTKPIEPEKYVPDKKAQSEVIEFHASKPEALPKPEALTRPAKSPLIRMKPHISPALQRMRASLTGCSSQTSTSSSTDIPIGTPCKNHGCQETYRGPNEKVRIYCNFHTGDPIFHEGMKYWSCCKKKTSDFNAFMEQAGCVLGKHRWIKESIKWKNCYRMDWHQTPLWVEVSIFAKNYDPDLSFVRLSSIKLSFELRFPSDNTMFIKTMSLYGIIDVPNCSVTMFPTKIEIKLKKAEAISWSQLNYPKPNLPDSTTTSEQTDSTTNEEEQSSENGVESVDLTDL